MDKIEFLSILVVGLLTITAMILSVIGLYKKDYTAKDLGFKSLEESEGFSSIELKEWLTNTTVKDGMNTLRGAIKGPVVDPINNAVTKFNTISDDNPNGAMTVLNTYYKAIQSNQKTYLQPLIDQLRLSKTDPTIPNLPDDDRYYFSVIGGD